MYETIVPIRKDGQSWSILPRIRPNRFGNEESDTAAQRRDKTLEGCSHVCPRVLTEGNRYKGAAWVRARFFVVPSAFSRRTRRGSFSVPRRGSRVLRPSAYWRYLRRSCRSANAVRSRFSVNLRVIPVISCLENHAVALMLHCLRASAPSARQRAQSIRS